MNPSTSNIKLQLATHFRQAVSRDSRMSPKSNRESLKQLAQIQRMDRGKFGLIPEWTDPLSNLREDVSVEFLPVAKRDSTKLPINTFGLIVLVTYGSMAASIALAADVKVG